MSLAVYRANSDLGATLDQFLTTIGANDDDAVIATERLFFAIRTSEDGLQYAAHLLKLGLLAPRPQAILLARIWHSGRPDLLDVWDPKVTIVPMFRAARSEAPEVLMPATDLAYYGTLPEQMTIYRASRRRSADRNPSWSLDQAFAARFLHAYADGPDEPRLFRAEIDRADVLAFFDLRGEKEVVVDPEGLRHVMPIPFI